MGKFSKVIDRLKEPSTWASLAIILSAFGINLEGELLQAITQVGIGIAAVLGIVLKETGENKK